MNMLQSGFASAERVFEFLDATRKHQIFRARSRSLHPRTGRRHSRSVFFSYEPMSRSSRTSRSTWPGQTVAIVDDGAGKTPSSTCSCAFMRSIEAASCSTGVDYRELSRDEVRSAFAWSPGPWMFAGDHSRQHRYGRPGASDAEVVDAAKAPTSTASVRTRGLRRARRRRLESLLGPETTAHHRARLPRQPEHPHPRQATSNVAHRTEVLTIEAMARLREGRTSFVIAHRLSTIREANTIIVMDHGKIVEQGSHAS